MNPAAEKREMTLGWLLAAAMVMHLLVLRPQAMVSISAFAVLLVGALLRGRHVYAPRWLGNLLLLFGAAEVIMAQVRLNLPVLLGEMAVMLGTILLLQPVVPRRAQRILFCMLIMLVAAMFRPSPNVGTAFIIFDVAVLYLLMEQAYRPPEIVVSFWASIVRSFRVIVPVGIVVMGVFWLFPSYSLFSPQAFTSFGGGDFLNPGTLAELSQSQRVALVAHFPEKQPMPSAGSMYWRGQVLEKNEGLRWSVPRNPVRRDPTLAPELPAKLEGGFRYTQELPSNRAAVVPVLDHAVFIEAKRDGQDVVVLERGAGVLSAIGAGALSLDVTSSTERLSDDPSLQGEGGNIGVPQGVNSSVAIWQVVQDVFPPASDTPAKLRALGRYFQKSGFRYSMRPGRALSVEHFLTVQRVGFCEHYATVSANLLRLAGVPARVVAGFRGGEWNPWLRTITVRDSDAHAWVEAWDASSRRWLRFDPTDFVAPELRAGIRRELDSSKWPWYRRTWSYGRAVVTRGADSADELWTRVTSSESWEYVPQALFLSLVTVALIWLVQTHRARRASTTDFERMARLLAGLERNASRFHRDRHAGETPLAWLDRLELAATEVREKQLLRHFSTAYEAGMYKAGSPQSALLIELRRDISELLAIWKARH